MFLTDVRSLFGGELVVASSATVMTGVTARRGPSVELGAAFTSPTEVIGLSSRRRWKKVWAVGQKGITPFTTSPLPCHVSVIDAVGASVTIAGAVGVFAHVPPNMKTPPIAIESAPSPDLPQAPTICFDPFPELFSDVAVVNVSISPSQASDTTLVEWQSNHDAIFPSDGPTLQIAKSLTQTHDLKPFLIETPVEHADLFHMDDIDPASVDAIEVCLETPLPGAMDDEIIEDEVFENTTSTDIRPAANFLLHQASERTVELIHDAKHILLQEECADPDKSTADTATPSLDFVGEAGIPIPIGCCDVSPPNFALEESSTSDFDSGTSTDASIEDLVHEGSFEVAITSEGRVLSFNGLTYKITGRLGEGGSSRVMSAEEYNENGPSASHPSRVAIKVMHKMKLAKRSDELGACVEPVLLERDLFVQINEKVSSPFLTRMKACFQDEDNFYFVMVSLNGQLQSRHC
jgi:hypothetical protein